MKDRRIQNYKVKKVSEQITNPFYQNPIFEIIRSFDYYGQPISLNFDNK